jgi:hypothetical protein
MQRFEIAILYVKKRAFGASVHSVVIVVIYVTVYIAWFKIREPLLVDIIRCL